MNYLAKKCQNEVFKQLEGPRDFHKHLAVIQIQVNLCPALQETQ